MSNEPKSKARVFGSFLDACCDVLDACSDAQDGTKLKNAATAASEVVGEDGRAALKEGDYVGATLATLVNARRRRRTSSG